MEIYTTNSTFYFGKYQGESIFNVWLKDASYIEWCMANISRFALDIKTYDELQIVRCFPLKDAVLHKLIDKDYYYQEIANEQYVSYGDYEGWYAQEEEGYSDQDIDDIFGGDPDMYWNID